MTRRMPQIKPKGKDCYQNDSNLCPLPSTQQPLQRGFTLIEVMVALGIVAIALAAGSKAVGNLTRNAERQRDAMLAQICADNALVGLRLSNQMPAVGESSATCPQAGLNYDVTLSIRPTPNPLFRRVDARVSRDAQPVLNVISLVGRL